MTHALDETDLRLLDALQRDNQTATEVLADRVGRSASAVTRRLKRLRDQKIIAADVSVVKENAAGFNLSAILQMQLERHDLIQVEAFCRRLTSCDNVQFCLQVSGTFDIVLLVVVRDMTDFNRFVDDWIADSGMVRRYETSFVKKRLKAALTLPLLDPDRPAGIEGQGA